MHVTLHVTVHVITGTSQQLPTQVGVTGRSHIGLILEIFLIIIQGHKVPFQVVFGNIKHKIMGLFRGRNMKQERSL